MGWRPKGTGSENQRDSCRSQIIQAHGAPARFGWTFVLIILRPVEGWLETADALVPVAKLEADAHGGVSGAGTISRPETVATR
jgi:hypothetical protein